MLFVHFNPSWFHYDHILCFFGVILFWCLLILLLNAVMMVVVIVLNFTLDSFIILLCYTCMLIFINYSWVTFIILLISNASLFISLLILPFGFFIYVIYELLLYLLFSLESYIRKLLWIGTIFQDLLKAFLYNVYL